EGDDPPGVAVPAEPAGVLALVGADVEDAVHPVVPQQRRDMALAQVVVRGLVHLPFVFAALVAIDQQLRSRAEGDGMPVALAGVAAQSPRYRLGEAVLAAADKPGLGCYAGHPVVVAARHQRGPGFDVAHMDTG